MTARMPVASGKPLPRVVLGTARLGSVLPGGLASGESRERGMCILDAAVEAGCTALDLAASYQLGGTERLVGQWMRERGNRDRLQLVTKGGHPVPVVAPHRLTPEAITHDLNGSLRRLQTDHVDLYLLHRDDPAARLEPLLEALTSLGKQGKFAAWGVSNWTHERIVAMDALAAAAGVPGIAASSPHFSLLEWTQPPWKGCVSLAGDSRRDARTFHETTQLPALAWSPLGRGFFASAEPARGDRTYGSERNVARRRRAQELAERRGVTAAQIALAYLFGQPFPVSAVVASSSVENMRANLAAAQVILPASELRWLESG